MTKLGFERLFFKCTDKFFETGKTPMNESGTILPKIILLNHMDRGIPQPVFSELYKKYGDTKAGWMLVSVFVAQLFKEILRDNLESEMLTINMFQELLPPGTLRPDQTEEKLRLTTSRIFGTHFSEYFTRN